MDLAGALVRTGGKRLCEDGGGILGVYLKLIRDTDAPYRAPLYAGRAFFTTAAEVALFCLSRRFVSALYYIYSRGIQCAGFYTQAAADAALFVNIDDPAAVDFHSFAFFRAGVITRVFTAMMACMYRVVHHARVFFDKNTVVTRTDQSVAGERADDFARAAAGAKRNFRRSLHNVAPV